MANIKRISIEQLKVGMYIAELNDEWAAESNLRAEGLVSLSSTVDNIKAMGIAQLYIDVEKGIDCPDSESVEEIHRKTSASLQATTGERVDAGCNVLEIGCGWGLGGIFCAKTFKANVTAIDADPSVFPYLHCHADHNDVVIQTHSCYFNEITPEDLACFDVVIGADICFWDELAEEVLGLVEKACEADVKKILISDPERAPFFEMAQVCADEFYGELLPYSVDEPRRARGAILVIENA